MSDQKISCFCFIIMIMALKVLATCTAVLIVYLVLLSYALASASNYWEIIASTKLTRFPTMTAAKKNRNISNPYLTISSKRN